MPRRKLRLMGAPLYLIKGQYYAEMAESRLLGKTAQDIRHYCRMKTYADGSYEIMVCDRPVFREAGYEERGKERPILSDLSDKIGCDGEDGTSPLDSAECNAARSRRRAANKVREIALCTDFRYFVTLTLNKDKIDRYDMSVIVKQLNRWLDHRVREDGLAYVLVPELHGDGAVHFHGFFNDALPVVDSGHYSDGRKVYNLPRWDFGFSTAVALDGDYHRAVGYCVKYVRKQSEKIGGRWYYSGGKLGKPRVDYPPVGFDWLEEQGNEKVYTFRAAGMTFKRKLFDAKGGEWNGETEGQR